MTELRQSTREALKTVATSTLTGALFKRGLRNMFLQDVLPLRVDQPRMVGIAYTMRFIPFRKDMNPPKGTRRSVQPQAMEQCPPGMCWSLIPAATRARLPPAIFTSGV